MINAPTLPDLGKKLRQATAGGKLTEVTRLIAKDTTLINKAGPTSGKAALHVAAEYDQQAIIEFLLSKIDVSNKAEVLDKTDFDGNTPLMLALINKRFKLARYLIEQNCKLDTHNNAGLNALHIAMSHYPDEQAIEITQLIKLRITQNPSVHITKLGDIKPLNLENIHQSLVSRFENQSLLQLPFIIISITENKDKFYTLIHQQLSTLNRLGYSLILREYTTEYHFVDEQALNDAFVKANFKQQEVGFSENQRSQALYRQKSAKFIAKQLIMSAKDMQGGVILLLNSGDVDANEVINKLPRELRHQCLYYSSNTSSDPIEALTSQLSQLTLCTTKEKAVEQMFVCAKQNTTAQSTDTLHVMAASLKRISEEFEIVLDSNKTVCGLLPFNEHNPLEANKYKEVVRKTQKKTGITPLLKWSTTHESSKPTLSMLVPDLANAKPPMFQYFPQSTYQDFQFENVLKYWLTLKDATTVEFKEFPSVERYCLKFTPGKEFILNEDEVVKLELIKLQKTLDIGADRCSRTLLLRAYLKIEFRNKPGIICPMIFSHSYEDVLNIECLKDTVEMLVVRGAIVDQSLADQEIRRMYNWQRDIYTKQYDQAVSDYYQLVHTYIGKLIISKLASIEEYITLVSFGCGAGKELFTIAKQLRENKYRVTDAIGIDINKNNFANNIKNTEGIQFIQGDLLQLHQLLEKAKYNQNSFKIGLFLGVLVAGCMKGSYHALQVLQQARNFDSLIICGMTVVILNKDILKAAGFEVEQQQTNAKLQPHKEMLQIDVENKIVDAKHLFYLTPMIGERRQQYLRNRGIKRSSAKIFDCLDLSFSAKPWQDLNEFKLDMLHSIKQVDISWSYLLDTEIEPFFKAISQFKISPLKVLVSNHQLGYDKIVKAIRKYPHLELIVRKDSKNEFEIPAYTPPEAKAMGIYKDLPYQKVSFKK